VSSITEKVLGAGTIKGVRPDHYRRFNRIGTTDVHDELIQLVDGEVSDLVFGKSAPTVILLAGFSI
jgi:signal recognition particle subunit SRP54